MTIIETTELTQLQKEAILRLWNKEYPEKLKYNTLSDFEEYLENLSGKNHYLLVNNEGQVKGWAFTFTRDEEKWFAIILDSSIQAQGYGTKMLQALKEKETLLNGWVMDHNDAIKADGTTYRSPLVFYIKNDFAISNTRLETEKISAVKITWTR